MKRMLSWLLVLLLVFVSCTGLADTPKYTVSGNVLMMDLDGDGTDEQIELTAITEDGMGYIDLNVSRQDVLISHMQLMSYSLNQPGGAQTQIKVYPIRANSKNLLYIETHATGAESVYSMWMVVSFENNAIKFETLMYDPGWTSGTALYEGADPIDSSKYLVYSVDYDKYNESSYLNTLESRFTVYGLAFYMAPLPFTGWYSAATLLENQYQACALNLSHTQLKALRSGAENSVSGPLPESTSTTYSITTTADVFLRNGAGTAFASLGVIKKGTAVVYLGQSMIDYRGVAWHYVSADIGKGWISSKYAKNKVVDDVVSGKVSATVQSTASIHVRSLPDLDAISLGVLTKGQKLTFLGSICVDKRSVPWFKVSYNGSEAWVSSKYSKLN